MNRPVLSPNTPPAHRPLSDRVARVWSAEPGRPAVLGPVNDGSERTDARTMARFSTRAWTRTNVPTTRQGAPCRALALLAPDGTMVVELDDAGAPIPVSEGGTRLVARLESEWDALPADAATVSGLRAESTALRYFLLHRVARETQAPPQLFHCLPWERVTATAGSATTLLRVRTPDPGAEALPPPDGELRHWFTPAATPLAGPLQVLDAGLRTGRAGPWFGREAAHLLSGLLSADTARLPRTTRHALADLAEALGEADRVLHHTAHLAATRLRNSTTTVRTAFRRRLDSDFVLRASSGEHNTSRTEFLEHWPVTTGLTVTAGGVLEIETEIEDQPDPPARRLADGPLFQPVTLRPATDAATPASGGTRYWMALNPSPGLLHGFLAVPLPGATFDVDLAGPPMPLRFLDRVALAEWELSLPANERVLLSHWRRMTDELPRYHPVRVAFDAYESGRS
ncbi:hypothetical protein ACQPXS_45600 [Streptomyces sp. CA-142005]|uniref:hypothetical protein n=1 Tax=Streptomyces sp. CA-142005 TaxID=3240052 RepID=UPI003D909E61